MYSILHVKLGASPSKILKKKVPFKTGGTPLGLGGVEHIVTKGVILLLPLNGSSSLLKHFQTHVYISYFHCFGP
jgi:hypothetical protein